MFKDSGSKEIEKNVHVVPCLWKHFAMLAELGANTFYETFSPYHSAADMHGYISATYSLTKMKENLTNPFIHYYAAYNQQSELGYIKLLEAVEVPGLEGKIMELEKIYVIKEAQGTPVGALLMEQAILTATSLNHDFLFLGVWQENKRAIAFYEKNGFEVFGTRNFKLGDTLCDDYLMKRKLT